jgi:2-polyprenyl-3-methyl-5-hydroxy-6-metoxy-1,4-benzoquinol methylase
MITRTLTPELLDSLPPDDPAALHSRRDLRWINAAMGNHRWFASTLPPLLGPGELALELGAGTGELAAQLTARGVATDGLDRTPAPLSWPAARAWHQVDLRDFTGFNRYGAVVGNLIFHHLDDGELAQLGARLSHAGRVIVASEPTRSPRSQRLIALAGRALGASHITLHDAHVSIAAGFRGDELPRLLGLKPEAWAIDCRETFLGAYRMIAVRHGPAAPLS